MKRFFIASVCLWTLVLAAQDADPGEEGQLIAVLQSNQSPKEKDAACVRLKWIGTARSIPALAELLTDPQLSHSARNALESMQGPEAEDALRQALAKTSGSNEVGVINSLGVRGGTTAVPDAAKLLSSSDPEVAVAAAEALGHMGGPEALAALQEAWPGADAGAMHVAVDDSLLACANRLLAGGDGRQALPVFQKLYDRETEDGVRLAAFRGIILSSEKRGITLMVKAITGTDAPSQGAALQLASKMGGPATTKALANLLSKAPVPVQIALLQALAQRGDRLAVPSIAKMVQSPDPDVRLAAITALGDLRDGSVALLLARTAASGGGAERTAARQALTDLCHGPVTENLLKGLAGATPAMQSELMRALGARGDSSAGPKLLELAQSEDDSLRSAVLQALALLAGPRQVPNLVDLVVKATNDDARGEAADALDSACQHIESQKMQLDAAPLVQAVQTAPLEARVALLEVCSGVNDPQIREALRTAARDPEPRVQEAALRALCDTQDPELLPDLLKMACSAGDQKSRLLAVQGCVRLATQDENVKLPNATKLDTLKAIIDTPLTTPEKRLVLSGLGSIRDHRALVLATPMLQDDEVQAEAAEAVINIAGAIGEKRPEEAGAALEKVLALSSIDPSIHKSAEKAYEKLQ